MEIDRTKSEELIIELNYTDEIIDERDEESPFNSKKMFDLLPETVVDKRTLQMVEIHDLFRAFDQTMTDVGSARLFHSLVNPSESIELIHAKHDSFCELAGNDRLREAIVEYLSLYKEGEKDLFRFLNAHLPPLFLYENLAQVKKTVTNLQEALNKIPLTETVYLDSLIKNIKSLKFSKVPELLSGQVYRTFEGLKTKKEKKFFTPGLRFRPSRISTGGILPFLPVMFFGFAWYFQLLEPAIAKSFFLLTAWLGLPGVMYACLFKPYFDWETAALPLRMEIINSDQFASAIEAVAAIDELLSFIVYCEKMEYPTCIPDITNDPIHSFIAEDLRNPIISKKSGDFVPNDVNLDGSRLTFVTGPNSGGKTTYCKTIAQNQILGQIGAPVAARNAKINMADRITYQAPAFDTLNDTEGRFGTELKETRDIFFSTSAKSLVVLDEIAEGTTSHEKLSLSLDIMNGFYTIGGNTVMVTHSFELVEKFEKENKGQYLQVEFNGRKPTHRLKQGISKESHALRVARKIGFAPEDVAHYLEEQEKLHAALLESGPQEKSAPQCKRRAAKYA